MTRVHIPMKSFGKKPFQFFYFQVFHQMFPYGNCSGSKQNLTYYLRIIFWVENCWTAPWNSWNLVMLVIYVAYGYSNKNETKIFLVGVIGYPCTCMYVCMYTCMYFPCGKCRTSLGKVPKKWISLALFELPQSPSPQIVPRTMQWTMNYESAIAV